VHGVWPRAFDRWQSARPFYGNWFRLRLPAAELDALEHEELVKDRVRVLLARWGLIFRELLVRELAPLQWGQVFRTLRLMELSGEVVAGHFFAGIRGLQFLSHAAFKTLRKGLAQDVVWWLSAADPASLAGVEVEGLRTELPARQRTTHLVYHGTRLVLVSLRRGKELDIRVAPEDPHFEDYLEVFKVLLTREFRPLRAIEIETINGEPALASPYTERLGEHFHLTREQRSVKLWKRY
ncbi:MAG: ATP-dependent helicase, partial [Thermoanaerobaculia bacterium]|nr:ATP-dependent helicase [Thermoanaerobaculia bacterium]